MDNLELVAFCGVYCDLCGARNDTLARAAVTTRVGKEGGRCSGINLASCSSLMTFGFLL